MDRICCAICHIKLEDDDIIIMDEANVLRHKECYDLEPDFTNPDFSKDVDTYKNLVEKYWFYQTTVIH